MNLDTLRRVLNKRVKLANIINLLEDILMNQAELLSKLAELTTIATQNQADNQANKDQVASLTAQTAELSAQIQTLTDTINNGEISPEVVAQVAALEQAVKGTQVPVEPAPEQAQG